MAGAESHADWAWIPSFAPHTRGSHTRVCGTAPARVAGMHQPPPQRLRPESPPPAHAALTPAAVRGRREPGERYANEVCTGVQRRCGCWACAHLRTTQRAHPGGRFHTALQRRARRSGRGARYAALFLSSSHSDLAGSHAADGRRRVHHTPPPALTNRERKRLRGAECLIAELPAAGRWPYGNERCGGDIASVPLHSRARPAARPRLGSFEASAATGRSCCDSGCC